MSEPELPGIPPPPAPPRPSWYNRLLARYKLPGWSAIGLGSLLEPRLLGRLFHLGEDIDFALNIVRSLGGELGMVATFLASPLFAIGLIAYGVIHLIFFGEPRGAL